MYLLLTCLEAEKSKIKMPANSVSVILSGRFHHIN
jgi:hypothetical protein